MLRTVPAIPLEGDLPGSAAGHVFADVAKSLIRKHGVNGVVLITSAESGAGRSTTAANLSLALLATGRSVLLLEVTDTAPRLEEVFGTSPHRHGIEGVLAGTLSIDAVICRREDNGLYLGLMKQGCVLDLASSSRGGRLTDLLRYARARFDWTVIDGPSSMDAVSVFVLAKAASQVIVVSGRRTTRMSCLTEILSQLAEFSPFVLLTN